MEKGSRKRERMAKNGGKIGIKKWGHVLYFHFLTLENSFPFIYVTIILFPSFGK